MMNQITILNVIDLMPGMNFFNVQDEEDVSTYKFTKE